MAAKPKTNKTPKKRGKPSLEWRKKFIASLKTTPVVSVALTAAGVSKSAAYNFRNDNEEFRQEWDDAIEEALDSLEQEALFRGKDGIEHPTALPDGKVVWIRRPSDKLLLRFLEAHRPERWAPAIAKEMAEAKLRQAMRSERVRIVYED